MTLLHQAAQKAVEALRQVTTSETFFRDQRGDRAGPAIDALESALQQQPEPVALTRFNECGGMEEQNPLERLRFFCALAMKPQDWMDVEQFFAALQQQEVPREPVAATALTEGFDGSAVAPGLNHSTVHLWYDTEEQARAARKFILEVLAASPSTTQQQEAGSEPQSENKQ